MIRRPPRSTLSSSSAASDVYKRQLYGCRNYAGDIRNARKRMGAVVETPSIYLDMTARENLMQQYRILGMPSSDGIDELLELVGLSDTGKKKAKNFSLGMRQRLGIAIALCGNPDFLVLDEPVNGLDPQGIVRMRELIPVSYTHLTLPTKRIVESSVGGGTLKKKNEELMR